MTHHPASGGITQTEPVAVFLAGLAGIIDLGLIAASALDIVHLTDGQTAAIVACVTAATALIGAVLRSKVWAPASVATIAQGPIT